MNGRMRGPHVQWCARPRGDLGPYSVASPQGLRRSEGCPGRTALRTRSRESWRPSEYLEHATAAEAPETGDPLGSSTSIQLTGRLTLDRFGGIPTTGSWGAEAVLRRAIAWPRQVRPDGYDARVKCAGLADMYLRHMRWRVTEFAGDQEETVVGLRIKASRVTIRVCVVGGGVAGCAIAARLTELGALVTLLEARTVGSGSTSRNAGGVRTQFGDVESIEYALETRRMLASWHSGHGGIVGFSPIGYVFLATRDSTRDALVAVIEQQVAAGGDGQWLDSRGIRRVVPPCNVEGVLGASWTPGDGVIDPTGLIRELHMRASSGGAEVREEVAVVGGEPLRGGGWQVDCSDGSSVVADVVVVAAGPWSSRVGGLFAANLPVTATISQVLRLGGSGWSGLHLPMVIGFDEQKAWVHPSGPELLGGIDLTRPCSGQREPGDDIAPEWEAVEGLSAWLERRLPALGDLTLTGGWGGLLELTPDERPLVGWTKVCGVYAFTGFSGHGLSLAPSMAADAAHEVVHGVAGSGRLKWFRPDRDLAGGGVGEVMRMH